MKLFVVCTRFLDLETGQDPIGGIHTYLEMLTQLAEKRGWYMTVLQRAQRPQERILDEAGRVRVLGVPTEKKQIIRDLIRRAAELGDPERDILLFATSPQIRKHPFRRSAAIQHGIYWDIPTVHGMRPPYPADLALRAIQARQIISQHRRVSCMICVDYNYVNWLRAMTVDRSLRYRVIPNASALPPMNDRREEGPLRMIFARRFETIRGVSIVEELLPRLLERYSELRVTLAGGGSLEQELRNCFRGEERVEFVCYPPSESLALHRRHHIAIVPTIGSEGSSLSLLEAMAAGCAVVCSDVGGMSNLVLDGFNGRILPPSAEAFYAALCQLIEDEPLRNRLAENGRLTVERAFSRERWEERWTEAMEALSGETESM